jgi:hypothetical protein
MKFREFVGEKKTKEIKKIVHPNIGSTEEDFLKEVARENPDGSRINTKEFYLGFGISKKDIKRVYDYLKSWFLRYHIPFKPINPYLTLYVLRNIPSSGKKRNFIKEIKKAKQNIQFNPNGDGDITFVKGNDIELRLEYTPCSFMDELEEIFENNDIEIVKEHTYIKIFEIQKMMDENLIEDMMYSCPKFPVLKIGNVGLLRRR